MQKTERTDAEVIEAFLAGDRSGFGVLVERYVRLAGSIAYRILGDYERAADAAQDAFLKAHKSLPGLRDPNRFSSWFYGVVRTVALDHRRKLRRRPGSLTAMTGYEDLVPRQNLKYFVPD